jgi:hypothetical protein
MGACISISNRIKAVTPHTGSFRFVPFCFRCVFYFYFYFYKLFFSTWLSSI